MYYVQGGKDEHKIDIVIMDPDKNIVFKRTGEADGLIIFDTTTPGEYTFIVSNYGDSKY